MTSDAKIGLLLGLVFIFIIAFVINGLPRFRQAANGNELTTNMVSQNDNLGITGNVNKIREQLDWDRIVGEPQVEQPEVQPQEEKAPQEQETEDEFRFKMKLPQSISSAQDTPSEQTNEYSSSSLADPFDYGAHESSDTSASVSDSSYPIESVSASVEPERTVPEVKIEVRKHKPAIRIDCVL